jgi:outer membrane autotransporter protein
MPEAPTAPVPIYRMEVPLYAEVPGLMRELTIAQLATFHDRQGAQSLLTETGALPAAWARVWGERGSIAAGGAISPSFDGTVGGVQFGQDVYADARASGHRNHYGFFLNFSRATGDVSGAALGVPDFAAGHLSMSSYGLGAYWTHIGPGGWYTDAVLAGSTLTVDPTSKEGIGASTHGNAAAASLEAGLPIPLLPGVRVEPQAQLIWQHETIHTFDDGISTIAFHADDAIIGRLGVRFEGRFETGGIEWLPNLRVNLWRYFGGTDSVTYGGATVLPAGIAATAAEFELGVVARLNARGSAYANFGYTTGISGAHRSMVTGNVGLRWRW